MNLGFPNATLGSSAVIGLDQGSCFDRYGRYGAYGLSRKLRDSGSKVDRYNAIDREEVNWAVLQNQCISENSDRFDMTARLMPNDPNYRRPTVEPDDEGRIHRKRSAVIFRSYDGFKYTSDTVRVMRSVIMELSLQSGGEFEAFLLVEVKNLSIPIFDDMAAYDRVVENSVPKEFWDMTVLWNEGLWDTLYPQIPASERR